MKCFTRVDVVWQVGMHRMCSNGLKLSKSSVLPEGPNLIATNHLIQISINKLLKNSVHWFLVIYWYTIIITKNIYFKLRNSS